MTGENLNVNGADDGGKLPEKNGESAEETVGALKLRIAELRAEIKAKDDEIRRVMVNAAVDAALIAAGARNVVAVKALITGLDKAELAEDGTVKGLEEKINAVKASDGYLFEQRGGKVTMRGAKPGESGSDGIDWNADISKMTYSQLADYIRKNPDAKIFD